jgi:hypothetical protein
MNDERAHSRYRFETHNTLRGLIRVFVQARLSRMTQGTAEKTFYSHATTLKCVRLPCLYRRIGGGHPIEKPM